MPDNENDNAGGGGDEGGGSTQPENSIPQFPENEFVKGGYNPPREPFVPRDPFPIWPKRDE
jgi:hypothetical protein